MENGIPILPWYDDKEDNELLKLTDYMKIIASVDDVRDVIRTGFSSTAFRDEFIMHYLNP